MDNEDNQCWLLCQGFCLRRCHVQNSTLEHHTDTETPRVFQMVPSDLALHSCPGCILSSHRDTCPHLHRPGSDLPLLHTCLYASGVPQGLPLIAWFYSAACAFLSFCHSTPHDTQHRSVVNFCSMNQMNECMNECGSTINHNLCSFALADCHPKSNNQDKVLPGTTVT